MALSHQDTNDDTVNLVIGYSEEFGLHSEAYLGSFHSLELHTALMMGTAFTLVTSLPRSTVYQSW